MKYICHNTINFIVGQSAQENWKAILQAKKTHHWVHADGIPSAHIIIETAEPGTEDIEYACNLCAEQTKITGKRQLYIISPVSNIKLGAHPGEVVIRDQAKVSHYLLKESTRADKIVEKSSCAGNKESKEVSNDRTPRSRLGGHCDADEGE
jgi:hypothetical protein